MELAPLLFISLLWGCSGRPTNKLVVVPKEPVVQYGDEVQLNCSLPCPDGTVQWKGLDTNLGSIDTFLTHSILKISSVKVATEGIKICQGTCGDNSYQNTAILKVYSLPEMLQLNVDQALIPGQPSTLHCSALHVYPIIGLQLTWYREDKLLIDQFEETETDEGLFDVVTTVQLSGEDVTEGVVFRCELTLRIGSKTFTRVASIPVSSRAVTEQSTAITTSTESPHTTATTMVTHSITEPAATTVPSPEPHEPSTALNAVSQRPETPTEWAAASKPTLPEHHQDPAVGTASLHLDSTAAPSTDTVSPAVTQGGTTVHGSSPGSHVTTPTCSLQIWSLPPNGTRGRALRIECQAQCTQNASVRWLHTPVALSQYREVAVGSGSTLWLDRVEPHHQGHYQCILLGRHAQAVSMQLVVSDDISSSIPPIAMGTTFSLLGLIVTGIVSRRLWKRFKSHYDLS
ncbi:mucosal addressin cell adhesion molecule 1 [Phasianus colchicus]|uniref:Ig-like domain-containing protein n=1 Tax=Phasianus colchicus TaxID=9054 RepID=A0A669QUW2_PHACC|nr:mucosal addressin cell adhesion molecule 1 [Phasianus colchicus]